MTFFAPTALTHLLVGSALAALVRHLRTEGARSSARYFAPLALGTVAVAVGVLVGQAFGQGFFGAARYAAWGLAVELPLLLVALAVTARGWPGRIGWAAAALALVAASFDAFVREPNTLEVRVYRVPSDEVRAPLRLAVVADLQHDAVGTHERDAIRRALEARPDVLLFAGDYAQTWHPEMEALKAETAAMLRELVTEAPPLGAYAVQGNVDYDDWETAFAGTKVRAFVRTETLRLRDDVSVTFLGMAESFRPDAEVPRPGPGLHVVVGHAPNYALSPRAEGDVLLAGHTHGGQIQLPFVGALVTSAEVPRPWADGLTRLDDGRVLVVSRGVGMQRLEAPRIRFLCLPDVTIVDVVPASQSQTETPSRK